MIDQRHPVAQGLGLVHQVGGQHDRGARLAAVRHQPPDAGHVDRVQAGEGLVPHQQLGRAHQGAHQLDLLLVALAQGLQLAVPVFGDAQLLQPVLGGGDRVAAAQSLELAQVGQHLDDLAAAVQPALLGQVADPVQVGPLHRVAEDRHVTRVGPVDVQQHADQRGLAGAVGAEQPEDLAGVHLQAHVAHRAHIAEGLADLLDREDRAHRVATTTPRPPRSLGKLASSSNRRARAPVARRLGRGWGPGVVVRGGLRPSSR